MTGTQVGFSDDTTCTESPLASISTIPPNGPASQLYGLAPKQVLVLTPETLLAPSIQAVVVIRPGDN